MIIMNKNIKDLIEIYYLNEDSGFRQGENSYFLNNYKILLINGFKNFNNKIDCKDLFKNIELFNFISTEEQYKLCQTIAPFLIEFIIYKKLEIIFKNIFKINKHFNHDKNNTHDLTMENVNTKSLKQLITLEIKSYNKEKNIDLSNIQSLDKNIKNAIYILCNYNIIDTTISINKITLLLGSNLETTIKNRDIKLQKYIDNNKVKIIDNEPYNKLSTTDTNIMGANFKMVISSKDINDYGFQIYPYNKQKL